VVRGTFTYFRKKRLSRTHASCLRGSINSKRGNSLVLRYEAPPDLCRISFRFDKISKYRSARSCGAAPKRERERERERDPRGRPATPTLILTMDLLSRPRPGTEYSGDTYRPTPETRVPREESERVTLDLNRSEFFSSFPPRRSVSRRSAT